MNLYSSWGISNQPRPPGGFKRQAQRRDPDSHVPGSRTAGTREHTRPSNTRHPGSLPALPVLEDEDDVLGLDDNLSLRDSDTLIECATTTGGVRLCPSAAVNWVYPISVPEREYQMTAISAALLTNALVCLPTGLGKTLIAAVVMHNFTRWFPEVI